MTENGKDTEMATTTTYGVTGMTCGHCVAAVTEEISRLEGVTDVDVELVRGGTSTVRVTSREPVDTALVRAAVDEAGYQLTGTDG
jgi:copper chaperone CopZ